ncbi:DUF1122 family protein [Caldivirga maquilingensis]|uniref:DUF1122 family protein n=1 Tax=Caldivirga maquilingensis TaxID=76887 RepID=UPI0018DC0693|nr:DUF1122 family protein [Caldivirga maquilingensis]
MGNLMGLVDLLAHGIRVNGLDVVGLVNKGRFREEFNIDLVTCGRRVLTLKVFLGRGPYYGPWVEAFNINPIFWASLDDPLIKLIVKYLAPGGVMYIEYLTDEETRIQLQRGYPPFLSRLGYIMLNAGFTWFKDWYYPEGWLEGGPKLEGQLPVNCSEGLRHWGGIREDALRFLTGTGGDEYWVKAFERASHLVKKGYECITQ